MGKRAIFHEMDVQSAAGSRSYERGLAYLEEVDDLRLAEHEIVATVYGSEPYEVVLRVEGHRLDGDCSCPFGQEGHFCKHCVAVALVALRVRDQRPVPRAAKQDATARVEAWLSALTREELLGLIRERAAEDEEFTHRLQTRSAAAGADFPALREQIAAVFDEEPVGRGRGGWDDWDYYGPSADIPGRLIEAADAIRTVLERGRASEAEQAARFALDQLARYGDDLNDDEGELGEAAAQMAGVHAAACLAARPDQRDLADWLSAIQLLQPTVPYLSASDYSEALGTAGLARYRAAIEKAWHAGRERGADHSWGLDALAVDAIRAGGDTDELVAHLAATIDRPGWRELRIAEELDAVGRAGEALSWAEEGAAGPDGLRERRLIDYLASRYATEDRSADILRLRRSQFEQDRAMETFRSLRDAAQAVGAWHEVKSWAVRLLEADAAKPPHHPGWPTSYQAAMLITALLEEGDAEDAWIASERYGAETRLRQQVADSIAGTRPADALRIYMDLIAPRTSQTGNTNYEAIADLLAAARGCHNALGSNKAFDLYLCELRHAQKRKRNLISLLDRRGLVPDTST
ncbi:putative Zn finger protein [Catenulispora sp. GAS73]|uniref:SWIM zinc finger family protein n=1 Tax=Catenulispora sp. GAS73 TaxID=3156269 RepID=UPI0035194250